MYKAKSHYRKDVAATYVKQRLLEPQWHKEQKIVDELIRKYVNRGESVLDAPLGTGRFIPEYNNLELQLYGLDVSEDMLNEAKKSLDGRQDQFHLIKGDIEIIPLPDNTVDHIICTRFLNWVPLNTVNNVLGEFNRVSRGKIIVEIRLINMHGALGRAIKTLLNSKKILKMVLAAPKKLFDYILRLLRVAFDRVTSGDSTGSGRVSQSYRHKSIMNMFSSEGLSVIEEIILDESEFNPRWITRPLEIFVLTHD